MDNPIQNNSQSHIEEQSNVVSELYLQLKKCRGYIQGVVDQTKLDGLNDGKGYSYNYVREVIVYQNYQNHAIIESAFKWLEEKLKASKAQQAAFEKRLADFQKAKAS